MSKILDKLHSLQELLEPYEGTSSEPDKEFLVGLIEDFQDGNREKLTVDEMSELNFIYHSYKDGNTKIDKKSKLIAKKVPTPRNTGTTTSGAQCNGIGVVFTGFRNTEFEKQIVKNGGSVYGSISSSVTHVICKNVNASTVKLKKARALGIKILDTRNFNDFVANI